MNPSTSSNAEPVREATFKVSTRQLAADLVTVGPTQNSVDLGQLTSSQLIEALTKLAQIGPEKLLDAEPRLVITGRRGRFLAHPHRGKLLLFDATDNARAPLEIAPVEGPDYLNGSELKPVAEVTSENLSSPPSANDARLGLAVMLMALCIMLVAGSAYFTFRATDPIEPDAVYMPATSTQLISLRDQVTGVFATGKGENSRTLTLRPEGTLTLVHQGLDNTADERADTYTIALRDGKTTVARTTWLGPIEVQDAKTLLYAGELYVRQP